MMRSLAVKYTLLGAGLGLLLSAQSCTVTVFDDYQGRSGPPAHAPAHGQRARYSYLYYPSSYVYFNIAAKVYFYRTGGVWRQSMKLPLSIAINASEAVSVEMDTDRPYQQFNTHKKKYPPGQLKKQYKRPSGQVKREQPPGKKKQSAAGQVKDKEPPGQTDKKDKETGKDKDKGKKKK